MPTCPDPDVLLAEVLDYLNGGEASSKEVVLFFYEGFQYDPSYVNEHILHMLNRGELERGRFQKIRASSKLPESQQLKLEIRELLQDGSEMGTGDIVDFFVDMYGWKPAKLMSTVLGMISEGILERGEHRLVRLKTS